MRFKYALKIAIHHPLKFFSYVFTFLILILVGIVFVSANTIVFDANKLKAEEKCHYFDFEMKLSSNSKVRFYDSKVYKKIDNFQLNFIGIADLFVFDTEYDGITVTVYSTTNANIKKILGYDLDYSDDEVIISKNLSERLTNNTISLNLLNQEYSSKYQISDDPFFGKYSLFLPKAKLIQLLGFSSIPNINNYYNTTYFKFADNSKITYDEAKNILLSEYSKLNISMRFEELASSDTITEDTFATINTIKVIFAVVAVIIVFILNSLISKMILDKNYDYRVLDFMGAKKNFFAMIWIIWFSIHFVFSVILSFFIAPILLELLSKTFYANYSFNFNFQSMILVISIIYIFFIALLLIKYFLRQYLLRKKVQLSNERLKPFVTYLVFGLALLISIISSFSNNSWIKLINVLSLLIVGMYSITLLYHFLAKVKGKKRIFLLFGAKINAHNKTYQNNMKIIFLVFILFFSIFVIKTSLVNLFEDTLDHFNFKGIVTNVSGDFEKSDEDIEGVYYDGAQISNTAISLDFLLAIDPNDYSKMINVESSNLPLKENEILVSESLISILNIKVNDFISINIDNKDYVFEVIGYIDAVSMDIGIINVSNNIAGSNSYFIFNEDNLKSNTAIFYYISFENLKKNFEINTAEIFEFVTLLCVFIVLSFIIILLGNMNNFFMEIQNNYHTVYKLGISKKDIIINLLGSFIFESIILIGLSLFIGYFVVISSQYMAGIFNVFFTVSKIQISDIIISSLLSFICLFFNYLYLSLRIFRKIYIRKETQIII